MNGRLFEFDYSLRLDFSRPARRHAFQLRCLPPEREGQRVSRVSFGLTPDAAVSQTRDGFGNTVLFGLAEAPHDFFAFRVTGLALLRPVRIFEPAANAAGFRRQTDSTRPGDAIRGLFALAPACAGGMALAHALMRIVHDRIAYAPSSTTAETTAEQAARLGCGVCQDHAHILLSLLRMAGLPCRYVSGLIPGEGQSHAWTEVYSDGCWTGLDATGGAAVLDTHIVLAVGRDHADCGLNRGVMLGGGEQTQTVRARVTERPNPCCTEDLPCR